jgi:glucan phosphorylase
MLFPFFWQMWPEKFQNKTNGVTPRRWIKFCNPELSDIITKWIGNDDWVLNTEKLSHLKQVIPLSLNSAGAFGLGAGLVRMANPLWKICSLNLLSE